MATKAQGTPTPVQAAYDAVVSASNTASLSQDCFAKLGSIFCAIAKLSEEHHITHQLARIGSLLADDFSNTNDCEREDLEEHFKTFRALLYPTKDIRHD